MPYRLFVRLLLITIAVVGIGYFAYQYVNPSGKLLVSYNFCQEETSYFSGLSPHGRVLELNKEACNQQMVIDPVYFDVRLPQSYQTAEIIISAIMPPQQTLAIGVGIDPENWQWEFAEVINDELYLINLNQAKFENYRYRFIISTPGLDMSGQEILFETLELNFNKEPLNSVNIWQRLRNINK